MLCDTKLYTGKNMTQECDKRNLVYETYCITCEERAIEKIKAEIEDDEKLLKEKVENLSKYKYIGETCRSVYERSWEHLSDKEQLKPGSHLLKHLLDVHEDEQHDEVKFGLKIIQHTKSSFDRQVLESVIIQQERKKHWLLNSKSEYNRCAVPRLTTKIGENHYKKYEKEMEQDREKEEILEGKIRKMRKERNKSRKQAPGAEQPTGKRRKVDESRYIDIREAWGRPENKEIGVKRKEEEMMGTEPVKKKKKNRRGGRHQISRRGTIL